MLAFFALLTVFSTALVSKADLQLAEDGTFHIAAFSDLHFGENESTFGIPADLNSAALMRQILDQEQPNFVVLNGDLITGENTFAFNSTGYVDQIVAPLVDGGYSWASTYGNHDSKYNLSREVRRSDFSEREASSQYTEGSVCKRNDIREFLYPARSGWHGWRV